MESEIDRNHLKYGTGKYVYDFSKFQTIRSFDDNIYNGKITITKLIDKKEVF